MFLFLDESTEYKKNILGCLVVPKNIVSTIEKQFVDLRIKHKLFGEIKWTNINQYYQRYKDFLDILDEKRITAHTLAYTISSKKYNAAYSLIRTVAWKLENINNTSSLNILFDNDNELGKIESKKIGKYLGIDSKVTQKINFCNQGVSHVLGCLQLVDLITGAVAKVANKINCGIQKEEIVRHLIKKNDNVPLNFTHNSLPGIYKYKIHHFDIEENSSK